jgi:hypothetical protein
MEGHIKKGQKPIVVHLRLAAMVVWKPQRFAFAADDCL